MKRNNFLYFVLILLIGSEIWFGYLKFRYPYLGVNVGLNDQNEWRVQTLDRPLSSTSLDVVIGDRILAIDGRPPEEHKTVTKWRAVEQADSILIERNGKNIFINTEKINNSLSHDVLPMIAEAICYFTAILLLVKVRNSRSALFLSFVFFNIGITFMSLGASVRGDTLGKFLIMNALTLIPIVFLHFLIVFFKEKGNMRLNSKYIPYLYCCVIIQSSLVFFCFFQQSVNYTLYQIISACGLLFLVSGTVWDILILIYLYARHRKEQQQYYLAIIIRFVLLSLVISFVPVITLSFLPRFIIDRELLPSHYTSWFVLVFPLTFAYLIITKKLFDIDMVLRRIAFTILMSIAPTIVITGVVYAITYESLTFRKTLFLFIFFLILLTFVLYSVEHMYTRLERFMFPRRHLLQAALKKISKDLTSTFSFRELKDLILLDIVNTLQVYGGAIVFKYRDSTEIISEGEIHQAEIERLIGQDGSDEHPDLMCFEINRHEEYTSFLVMTRKKSNTRLGLEEVQWLNLIISYLAVSLENVYLIRKLTDKLNSLASHLPGEQGASDFNWFRKLSFELQERERVRIATDLHDTTMQDLFFLKRKLKALGEKHVLSPEVNGSIQSLIEYIEIINVNLRQNCFDLHPYLLQEIGLVRTIEKIVERESYACPFQIRFDAVGVQMIERKDLEFKRHLFRIVQELLNNAKKHSEATLVSIRLTASMGYYVLHYRDDGVGFDPSKLAAPDIGTSGVGMEQLRSRILHMGGHLELAAAQGSGVDIRISFPMKEGLIA